MAEEEIRGADRSRERALHEEVEDLRMELGNRAELLAFLAEAGRVLNESLDYRATLRRVAKLALPYLGGWSIVDLCTADGRMERVAIVHPDPEMEKLARELEGGWPPERDDPIGIPAVARTREPLLVRSLSDEKRAELAEEENREVIERLGVRSVITVPLISRDRVLGAMTFVSGEDDHRFDENDLRLAHELGTRCALALDNALLYEEAQGRSEAEAGRKQVADILDRSLDGFVAFDGAWRFTYANQRAERVLGASFTDLEGRSLREALPGAWESRLMEEARRAVREKRTVEAEEFVEDHGAWYHAVCYPSTEGATIQFRDITERKRTEFELARAEEHYHRLVETSPYGIFVLDLNACFVETNSAMEEILGLNARDFQARALTHVVSAEHQARASSFFLRALSGERDGLEIELHLLRPGEQRRLCSITATAIRDGDSITGVYGVARDITEEREREVQLRRAERLASLGTLLSGVAHELDNPLTSIRGFAEFMLMDEQSDSNRDALEVIQREADRTSKIVSDLRLLARHTQDEPRGDRIPVDLNDVVRHVYRIRKYSLETNNIHVKQELEEDLPKVLADRGQMEQVILNLVVNAEQALSGGDGVEDRRIRLATYSSGEDVIIEVDDTGPGISPAELEKIFDPFWSTRRAGGGSGLGLSLVHNMVSEHDGRVSVESGVGEGATFIVTLPALTEATAPVERKLPPRPPPPSRTLRVLVVDDEESIRRLLVLYLERQGHRVEEAAEGEEALQRVDEAAADGGFDVVLTDLRMPGMGGARFFEELRARSEAYVHRVVFMTGEAASGDAARILAATGAPVLFKPVALKELLRVLEDQARAPAAPFEKSKTGAFGHGS